MTRVAVIDCGTNSLRLLVTDIDGESQRDVDRRLEIVRLGQGVDRTGRFAPEALARAHRRGDVCRRFDRLAGRRAGSDGGDQRNQGRQRSEQFRDQVRSVPSGPR